MLEEWKSFFKVENINRKYYIQKKITRNIKDIKDNKTKNKINVNKKKKYKKSLMNKSYKIKNIEQQSTKLLLIFILVFLPIFLNKEIKVRKLIFTYDIKITINKSGNQKILSDTFENSPNSISINGQSQYEIKKEYNLESETNTIIMKWNDLENCNEMFKDLSNIDSIEFSNFESANILQMASMFYGCSGLTELNLEGVNTGNVIDLSHIFDGCSSLISLNLDNWDLRKVNNMDSMFSRCSSLTTLNLNFEYNTESLTIMTHIFRECNSLQSLDLRKFDTSKVEDFAGLFYNCNALKSIDLSSFITDSVNSFWHIFYGCNSLESLDINHFNVSKVKDMSSCFENCKKLKTLNLSNFETPNLINMWGMFHGCTDLESIDLSKFDTSQVTDMSSTFQECSSLKSLDLSNFITTNLKSIWRMFYNCNSLKTLKIQNFKTDKIADFGALFYNCTSLEYLDLSNFITTTATSMWHMFEGCYSLKSLDISAFNTELVENMESMFYNCYSLISLNLSHFNTENVVYIASMFYNCYSLEELDIIHFNPKKANDMAFMFYNCSSLISLNLDNFNTESVQNMFNMFSECNSIKYLNLSSFNTESVLNMEYMFSNCQSLTSINLQSFDTFRVTKFSSMFSGCSSLIFLDINHFNIRNATSFANFLLNCNENLTYCFREEKMSTALKNELKKYEYENNCLEICISQSNKFINATKECVENCENEDYQYEYNSICYDTCPKGSHKSSEDSFICEEGLVCDNYYNSDKTDCYEEIPSGYYVSDPIQKTLDKCNVKCKECDLTSIQNNLCKECNNNEGYYPKNNDPSNIDSYIKCYLSTEQIGYYLDLIEKVFKGCYSICKKCNDLGNAEDNKCTECYDNYELINGNCYKSSESINKEKILDIDNYKYFYEINDDINKIKTLHTDFTFIDIKQETMDFIIDQFNLDEDEKLYMYINDYPSNNSNKATIDYDYKIYLENGTELKLSEIKEDFYVNVYVPITDLDLANYNYSKYFAEKGYDIYDKNSDFYNNICTPAYLGNGDLILKDRKKEIYPNNVTLCGDGCTYNGVNIEEKRIICSCNLNGNNNINTDEDDFLKEDDGNFLTYFLDNINYKIFKCYSLFSNFKNLKNNYAFYTILGIYVVILILNFYFKFISIKNFCIAMLKEVPRPKEVKIEIRRELEKRRTTVRKIKENKNNPNKRKHIKFKTQFQKSNFRQKEIRTKKHRSCKFTHININNSIKNNDKVLLKSNEEKLLENSQSIRLSKDKVSDNKNNLNHKINIKKVNINTDRDDKTLENKEINELTYKQALIYDKRNIFQIFGSLIIVKLEFINLFFGKEKFKLILVCEYILSLLLNFFFNTLLYSDDIISDNYHNNGELDFFVTLILSLLSNIITSILLYFIRFSNGIEERIEDIKQLKSKRHYIRNIIIYKRYLILKFILFFIGEIFIVSCCFYYIVIFCIIYNSSKVKIIINYLMSLLEGFITAIAISLIVLITRKIGLEYQNKYLYNTSKYFYTRF